MKQAFRPGLLIGGAMRSVLLSMVSAAWVVTAAAAYDLSRRSQTA